jgi:opacity protein-like surface antigen
MHSMTSAISAILLLAAGLAPAVEPADQHWEVRIVGDLLPGFDSGVTGAKSRLSDGGELLAVYHLPLPAQAFGVVFGAGLFDDSRRSKVANPDNIASYDAQGIMILGGITYALAPRWSLEADGEVRGGEGRITAKQTFDNGDFQVLGDYGRYLAASVLAGVSYECTDRLALGLAAGYDSFQGKSDFVAHAVTVRGNGLIVQLRLGFFF